jgi:sortase A
VLAIIVGLLGAVLLGAGLWIPAKAMLARGLIESAWSRVRAGETNRRAWSWADTWPVARLIVPKLEQDFFVLAGTSGESMAFGPAHVSRSARPGEADNIAFAGHRDTHFRFLRELEKGDEIIVESQRETHRYRVDGFQVVHESRTDLLMRSGQAELTLITCYPFDSLVPGGPLRYVVHAIRDDK